MFELWCSNSEFEHWCSTPGVQSGFQIDLMRLSLLVLKQCFLCMFSRFETLKKPLRPSFKDFEAFCPSPSKPSKPLGFVLLPSASRKFDFDTFLCHVLRMLLNSNP